MIQGKRMAGVSPAKNWKNWVSPQTWGGHKCINKKKFHPLVKNEDCDQLTKKYDIAKYHIYCKENPLM